MPRRWPGVTVVGLTGNIGTGKSTVMHMLADLGATIIDADRLSHEVIAPGTPGWGRVVEAFGRGIVAPDGSIDRAKLGALVFSDPSALARLEAIIHPEVIRETDRRIRAVEHGVVVIEAIKLIEAGMHRDCDALWVVTCRPEQQLERLMRDRRMSEAEARRRIAAQPPQSEKVALADVVIDNSGTLEETRAQVEAAWKALSML
jgi:dephospho-CoA kinase